MFAKILVPLDGSEAAEYALVPALALAESYGATLLLLCTCKAGVDNGLSSDAANDRDWFWSRTMLDSDENEQQEYVDGLLHHVPPRDIQIDTLFVKGDEAGAIIGIAEVQDIDLIVMTKHCRTHQPADQLGHVTERVLHHASCSVMVICPKPGDSGVAYPAENYHSTGAAPGSVHA